MKKTLFLSIPLLAAAWLLAAGCASQPNKDEQDPERILPTPGVTDQTPLEEAGDKLLDSVIEGLETGNYSVYSRDFTKIHRENFDEAMFNRAHDAIVDKLGKYEGRNFLGYWKKQDFYTLLWKTRFSKTKDDILMKMYLRQEDGKYKIIAFKVL